MAFFGLGSSKVRRDTPEQIKEKLTISINKARESLEKIMNESSNFRYKYIDKNEMWPEFIEICPHPYVVRDLDGTIINRTVILVNLKKIPEEFKGDFQTLEYTNQLGEKVSKQAFYRSSGKNSRMKSTWLPFDGISYVLNKSNGTINTRFEKDNFNDRFGEISETDAGKKLGLVSQILGGGVWNIKNKINSVLRDRNNYLQKVINDLDRLSKSDDINERNRINSNLKNLGNIWKELDNDEDENDIPNVLEYEEGIYHNPEKLTLSDGIYIPKQEVEYELNDETRMMIAGIINIFIKNNNSLQLDFSEYDNNVPSLQELYDGLVGKESSSLGREFASLKSSISYRL